MKDKLIQSFPEPFNFYRIVLDSDHLHFGLWKEDEPDMTLEEAQENMFRSLLNYFPLPPAKVLDVGCGLGISAYCLAEKGYEVQAISPSQELIAYAEYTYPHPNLAFHAAGFSENHPVFGEQAYDVILFQESLQYLSPLEEVFQKARNLLKKEGSIIVSDEMCHDISVKPQTAVHLIKNTVSSLLERGFRITSQKEMGNQVAKTIDIIIGRFEKNREKILQTVKKQDTQKQLDFFLNGWKLQKQWYASHQMGYHMIVAKKDDIYIQPCQSGDEHIILDMFNKVFQTNRTIDHWYWKFRDNPFGSYKIAKAVTEDNALAAHFCGYPVPLFSSGKNDAQYLILHGGDTMTHPDFRHVGRGKTSILGRAASYFYNKFCMDLIPFIYGFNTGNIRKFGERFLQYQYLPHIPYHVLNVTEFQYKPSVFQKFFSGFSLAQISDTSSEYDVFFKENAKDYGILIKRDSAYLKWRYLDCPDHMHKIFAVKRFGRLIGWGVFSQKEKKLIWGDAMFDRKYPQAISFMLNHLILNVYKDAERIEGWFSPVPAWWVDILKANGFQITEEPNRLAPVFTFFDETFSLEELGSYFYYTMGDSDLF